MKLFSKLIQYILFLVAVLLSLLSTSLKRFIFAGSLEQVTEIFSPAFFWSLLCLVFLAFVIFFFKSKIQLLLFLSVFFMWILSGRTIGFNTVDYTITTGWHNIPFNQIELCREGLDCEKLFNDTTVIKKENLLFIKFSNDEVSYNIFTGPFFTASSRNNDIKLR